MTGAFSQAQLRASLWARSGARVHAVIDGRVVPGIGDMLKGADVAGWDCLQRGALTPDAAAAAAYLAELKDVSPFTDWLFDEATPTFPGWGILTVSTRALLQMREHCRGLCDVITPDGQRRAWRWYDPDVLRLVLPTLLVAQLDEVFAAGQTMVIPAADAWTWLQMENGVLASDIRQLLRPAR